MKELPRISEAEFEVMKVVWEGSPISTNQVVEALKDRCDWSPKTIQTLLTRLEKKAVLSHRKEGRVYVYTPKILKEEYIKKESQTFLNRFYQGALSSMVLNFLEDGELSGAELEELQGILSQAGNSGGK